MSMATQMKPSGRGSGSLRTFATSVFGSIGSFTSRGIGASSFILGTGCVSQNSYFFFFASSTFFG